MTTTPREHADTAVPPVVSAEEWQEARAQLLVVEKAHTHEGDAVAAQRRRLPMTEVDANLGTTGASGPTTLLDMFVSFFFTRPAVILLSRRKAFAGADVLGVHQGEATGASSDEALVGASR